jgi:hypothetical protein
LKRFIPAATTTPKINPQICAQWATPPPSALTESIALTLKISKASHIGSITQAGALKVPLIKMKNI